MSEVLKNLPGLHCRIRDENEEYLTGSADILCDVDAVDSEWIRISYTDERGRRGARLDRVESLQSIEIYL